MILSNAFEDFKKYVIDVAVNQINEHSDIRVKYTQRKTDRTVTHLIFEITPEPKAKAERPKKERTPVAGGSDGVASENGK